MTRAPNSRRAYTLTELLISIGILGVLIALTVPALRGARGASLATVSIANLRSIGQTLEHHRAANNDLPPYPPQNNGVSFGPFYWEPNPPAEPENSHWVTPGPWGTARFWPGLRSIHDVAPWPEHFETWLSPGYRLPPNAPGDFDWPGTISYHYSNSFLASPRVWNGDGSGSAQDIGPVRGSTVAFPSSKVVMYDAERAYLVPKQMAAAPRPVLFVDGSASLKKDADASVPVPNPLNDNSQRRYHDTRDGSQGRDF
ncbi:MAG: type II secretion system protein [Phycisphaerales bacterium]|nr:type II secretion system protein [Phycisphaerales bacterium]